MKTLDQLAKEEAPIITGVEIELIAAIHAQYSKGMQICSLTVISTNEAVVRVIRIKTVRDLHLRMDSDGTVVMLDSVIIQ